MSAVSREGEGAVRRGHSRGAKLGQKPRSKSHLWTLCPQWEVPSLASNGGVAPNLEKQNGAFSQPVGVPQPCGLGGVPPPWGGADAGLYTMIQAILTF